jgi:hypothetical protein
MVLMAPFTTFVTTLVFMANYKLTRLSVRAAKRWNVECLSCYMAQRAA